jgi:hypothetical protein
MHPPQTTDPNELTNLERFACVQCFYDWTTDKCLFVFEDELICRFPYAFTYTQSPDQYENKEEPWRTPIVQSVPIHELRESPFSAAAKKHQAVIESGDFITERNHSADGMWSDVVPIRQGKLVWEDAHYLR